jgi:glucuronosyltransferase
MVLAVFYLVQLIFNRIVFVVTPRELYQVDAIPSFLNLLIIWQIMVDGTLKSLNSKFDVVMVELFFHEAFYAFAHKYDAPIILLGTGSYWRTVDRFMGVPSALSYSPHELSRYYSDMTLFQRLTNFFFGILEDTVYRYWYVSRHNDMIQKYFAKLKQPLPTVAELEKKVSLVMFNTHYSIDAARPLVPGIIEVAGVHLKPPKKLPEV